MAGQEISILINRETTVIFFLFLQGGNITLTFISQWKMERI